MVVLLDSDEPLADEVLLLLLLVLLPQPASANAAATPTANALGVAKRGKLDICPLLVVPEAHGYRAEWAVSPVPCWFTRTVGRGDAITFSERSSTVCLLGDKPSRPIGRPHIEVTGDARGLGVCRGGSARVSYQ